MAKIIKSNGLEVAVKNLGWLMKKSRDMVVIAVIENKERPSNDAILSILLSDGTVFTSDYASATILRSFLSRPKFKGIPLSWYGVPKTC